MAVVAVPDRPHAGRNRIHDRAGLDSSPGRIQRSAAPHRPAGARRRRPAAAPTRRWPRETPRAIGEGIGRAVEARDIVMLPTDRMSAIDFDRGEVERIVSEYDVTMHKLGQLREAISGSV